MVELALLLPLLLALLLMSVEGGLYLGEYITVVNSAREGARYLLDGGDDAGLPAITRGVGRGLTVDASRFDVWAVRGAMDVAGAVTITSITHPAGAGPALPAITSATLQSQLSASGILPTGMLRFVLVEVAYRHESMTGTLVLPAGFLTLRSYSLIRLT